MMSKYKTFIAHGVINSQIEKPRITVFSDPTGVNSYIASIENMDCGEMVNGYSYDELLSIRNTINEALTDIDVRESVAELNKFDPRMHPFND